jgi:predicted anti-sigma-YlaC factor YlaD
MKKADHKEIIEQLCDAMGEDLDTPVCREVAEHLSKCPECQAQFDTVRQTVSLCRQLEHIEKIPGDVHSRLFKILNLPKPKK